MTDRVQSPAMQPGPHACCACCLCRSRRFLEAFTGDLASFHQLEMQLPQRGAVRGSRRVFVAYVVELRRFVCSPDAWRTTCETCTKHVLDGC